MLSFKKNKSHPDKAVKEEEVTAKIEPVSKIEPASTVPYSAGFEKIYALENVDIKSVRKVTLQTAPTISRTIQKIRVSEENYPLQFNLKFSPIEEGYLESFILDEPIQVLKLSIQAEKRLLEQEIFTIRDLHSCQEQGFTLLKGMGQGHMDEIKEKLNQYIDGIDLYRSNRVDYLSLLRALVGTFDPKKIHLILTSFKLADCFPITVAEKGLLRRLVGIGRDKVLDEAILEFKCSERCDFLNDALNKIYLSFIRPWIQMREGVATSEEITERIIKMSTSTSPTLSILSFFDSIFFEGNFCFKAYLFELEENIYAIDEKRWNEYSQIIKLAKSYFYKPNMIYILGEMITFIAKELCSEWSFVSLTFIEKTLRISSQFCVRKDDNDRLVIRLL